MKVVVEKAFELWEKRTHTEHDTPACGLSETREISRKRQGSYKTKTKAEKARQSLIARHLAGGVYKISRLSTPEVTELYEPSVSDDIVIWVQEKVLSEQRVG